MVNPARDDRREIVLFRMDRKVGLLMLGVATVVLGGFALGEQLMIATSYPIPSAIYAQLITTGQSNANPSLDTVFNRDGGDTLLVPSATNLGGKVGIGALDPASTGKLQVAGTADVTNLQVNGIAVAGAACSPNGLVARDAAGLLLSCQSLVWKSAAGGSSTDFGAYTFQIPGYPTDWFYGIGKYNSGAGTFSGDLMCDPAVHGSMCGSSLNGSTYRLRISIHSQVRGAATGGGYSGYPRNLVTINNFQVINVMKQW